ncbi:MAG: S-adenosylmethionine synthase [Candidatus Methanophagaceae archaeon]|nr:MAG: S-adenosylmethionine synthase [Methanophagales archaeon]
MSESVIRNINVEFMSKKAVGDQGIEIVERKGLGHPDSLCDGIADAVSVALCKEYERKCGMILHHNTDKVQLVAGRSCPVYGGGELISPIYIMLGGRATGNFGGDEIAVDIVTTKATKEYLKKNVRNLDVESNVVVESRLGKGSSDLLSVFGNNTKAVPVANDTSFGVAHAPFSETESVVFNVENEVMAKYRDKEKAIGEDMKVMALREEDKINLTVGDAFVSKYVDDYEHYEAIKRGLKEFVSGVAERYTSKDVTTHVNMVDTPESVHLTVTGTSAEMGDDGAVGRGNRCNGLITPNRSISLEASAGKNPVNHTGKIYNLLAGKIANEIVDSVEGVREVDIKILSEIGRRIDDPKVATAQIITNSGVNSGVTEKKVERVIDDWLSNITDITEMVIRNELKTF